MFPIFHTDLRMCNYAYILVHVFGCVSMLGPFKLNEQSSFFPVVLGQTPSQCTFLLFFWNRKGLAAAGTKAAERVFESLSQLKIQSSSFSVSFGRKL